MLRGWGDGGHALPSPSRPTSTRASPGSRSGKLKSRSLGLRLNPGDENSTDPIPWSCSDLIRAYIASQRFARLAPTTQASYRECARQLHREIGKIPSWQMLPVQFRRYMDSRPPVRANRERSLLISAWKWGRERGLAPVECVPEMVTPYPETPRDRYVTDGEFQSLICRLAWRWTPGCLAAVLAYSLGARLSDVLKIRHADCSAEGVFIRQGKTGKKQLKGWTPGLVTFLEGCPLGKDTLVEGERSGKAYTASGFKAQWKKIARVDFTFHDLKAKAISDFEGDKRLFSGHADYRMVARVYNRLPEKSSALDFRTIPNIAGVSDGDRTHDNRYHKAEDYLRVWRLRNG